jgi:Kef-type K+ transport system membrane component KefB
MAITCPHCGAVNAVAGAFCESCGKALPSVVPSGPRVLTGDAMPTSGAGRMAVSDDLQKKVKQAGYALLAVAIIQTIIGPVMLFASKAAMEKQSGGPVEITAIGWIIVFGVAAAFWILYIWSRFQPLAAAIVGMVLYVTILLLDAIADPMTLAQGLIMKVIIIAVLAKGISAALQYKRMQAGEAPATA